MSNVKKNADISKWRRLTGTQKLHIASQMTDAMVKVFKDRIKLEHPRASAKKRLEILRKELSYGRKDNV